MVANKIKVSNIVRDVRPSRLTTRGVRGQYLLTMTQREKDKKTCYSRHRAFSQAGNTFSARSCKSLFVIFSSFLPMSLIEKLRFGFEAAWRSLRVGRRPFRLGVICPRVRAVLVLLEARPGLEGYVRGCGEGCPAA